MKQIIVNNIRTTYYITEDGKCYNQKTGNWLEGQINQKNGYKSYYISYLPNKKKRIYAHRLVAEAYISNPKNKKQVNHIDGNKLNNCVDNLEWVSGEENQQHALQLELRKFRHVFCFNREKQLVAEYKTIQEAAKAVNLSPSLISQQLNKDIKNLCGSFYWSYDKELKKTTEYKNTGKAKKVNQYDLKGKYIMTYPSAAAAGRAMGAYNGSHISECCRGNIKTYKGFVWRYVDDIVSPSSES